MRHRDRSHRIGDGCGRDRQQPLVQGARLLADRGCSVHHLPVTHADTPDDMVRKGRHMERRIPAEGDRLHLEGRVVLNGSRTMVLRS